MVTSLLTRFCLITLICGGLAQGAFAQDAYLRALEITTLAQEDPDAANAEIDAALAAEQAKINPDLRLLFDLARLKADIFKDQGQMEQAAAWVAELAALAAGNRDLLQKDPIPLHDEAAQLLEGLGDLRGARAQVTAILEAQRDGAEPGAVLAQTLGRLAAMSEAMGRADQAERYTEEMESALTDTDTSTRGQDGTGYREVEVFYATDRARTGDPKPEEFYGWGRGELELGTATVTIPDIHTKGLVETPSIWRLEFGPNPAKHVVLRRVEPVADAAYFAKMQQRMTERPNKELFVFIHGYNVDFAQATKRAAQIAYDMNYGGLPVLYSWPSAGSTLGYISDTAVVRLSGRRLSGFLEDLVAKSGADTVHIVAHSMGNRALTDALELIAARNGLTSDSVPIFGQVLFAAPDVDAGLFSQMIQTIRPIAKRLTLYASHQDWALAASRRLHGSAPRAGQGGEFVLVDDNVDSVDMSELGEDMLAHSYFADESSALADMMSLFWKDASPRRRCGLQESRLDGAVKEYWSYRRDLCASKTLIDAMALMARNNVQSADDAKRILRGAVEDSATRAELEPILLRMLEGG
ncbi:MAG: alpha/beta fold hydrolase [Pseudomonadota bacterium]